MRILIRGVNWLGDAVMSSLALGRLREARPGDELVLLTPEKLKGLWEYCPALNGLITFPSEAGPASVAALVRNRGFDLGLIFPGSFRSAFEVWRAGIPRRIGYRGQARDWLLTDPLQRSTGPMRPRRRSINEIKKLIRNEPVPAPQEFRALPSPADAFKAETHHHWHYLHLLTALGIAPRSGAPVLVVPAEKKKNVWDQFQLPLNKPVIAVQAGAEYGPAKRWPSEHFATAVKAIQASRPSHWVLTGSPADHALACELERHLAGCNVRAVTNLAGRTTLTELCALLAGCALLISNDTGPMHVAGALGTPVIALFGSTSPAFTAPLGPHPARTRIFYAGVSCSPCFRRECPIDFRCMLAIDEDTVASCALELLSERIYPPLIGHE